GPRGGALLWCLSPRRAGRSASGVAPAARTPRRTALLGAWRRVGTDRFRSRDRCAGARRAGGPGGPSMSKQRWWRRYGWGIGAAVGVAATLSLAPFVQEAQEEREAREWEQRVAAFQRQEDYPPPPDVVRELLAQEGRVVIADRMADRIDPEDEARAEQLLAA